MPAGEARKGESEDYQDVGKGKVQVEDALGRDQDPVLHKRLQHERVGQHTTDPYVKWTKHRLIRIN